MNEKKNEIGDGGDFRPVEAPPPGIGERGVPGVGVRRGRSALRQLPLVIAAIAVVIFGTGAVSRWLQRIKADHETARTAEIAAATQRKQSDASHNFGRDQAALEAQRKQEAQMAAAQAAADQGKQSNGLAEPAHAQGASTPASQAAAAKGASAPETPAMRRLDGDVLVGGDDAVKGAQGSRSQAEGTDKPVAGGLDDKLQGSRLTAVKAGWMPNPDYLMARGTTIPCVQNTEIVTDYPGLTSCHLTKDVYSANGRVLLAERGSEVTGEQRQALMQGQARIFVIWTRLVTPHGVAVQLDSPGASPLGGSGLPAYVDTHFWTRFGGAIMLSLVSDAGQALSSLASNSGGGSNRVQFNSTSQAGQSVAAETLRNTINVPPTAYSLPGSALTIFVARDVDFSDVYELAKP